MGDQTTQRFASASTAALACQQLLAALHTLQNLAEKRPFLGNFADSDFVPVGTGQGTAQNATLKYLDAATVGVLFDFVVPSLLAAYADAANAGRNKQILNQVAPG